MSGGDQAKWQCRLCPTVIKGLFGTVVSYRKQHLEVRHNLIDDARLREIRECEDDPEHRVTVVA